MVANYAAAVSKDNGRETVSVPRFVEMTHLLAVNVGGVACRHFAMITYSVGSCA